MQLLCILHFRLSTNCPFKWKTKTSALWSSIIEWSHFNFISCLRQLFYWTQIDDLFRFVINQLCPAVIRFVSIFFSWFIPFFFFWAGKTFWRTGFLAEILQLEIRVYLISSIFYQFDPDIRCRFYWFCYLFLFSGIYKIGIFCVIMRRSLA